MAPSGWRRLLTAGLVAAVALVAQHALSFARTVHRALTARASSIVLEPPGLGAALRAMPRREITEEDLQTLERDGVVKVSGLVDPTILRQVDVDALLWDHAQEQNLLHPPYYFNGAVRALLRDGPLAAAAARALAAERVVSQDMQIWAQPERSRETVAKYHVDERWAVERGPDSLLTVWLAVTDAPHAVRFVRGSHKIVKDIYAECGDAGQEGSGVKRGWLHRDCIEGAVAGNLTERLGYEALWKASAAPGDAFLFYSHLVHAGVMLKRRTAVCIRFRAGRYAKQGGGRCLRDHPYERAATLLLHPPSREVDCLPWQVLPELADHSPVVAEASTATSGLLYWARLYGLHLTGRAVFVQRNPALSLPRYRDL